MRAVFVAHANDRVGFLLVLQKLKKGVEQVSRLVCRRLRRGGRPELAGKLHNLSAEALYLFGVEASRVRVVIHSSLPPFLRTRVRGLSSRCIRAPRSLSSRTATLRKRNRSRY